MVSLDYGIELKIAAISYVFGVKGPTFILECSICLDYEEVILRESEQVRIFTRWRT